MNRLLVLIKADIIIQIRNHLYSIGIIFSLILAIALGFLASPDQLPILIPVLNLLAIGGTTLLYVAAIIIFEKDQGTLNALIVSPVKTSEYLWSKIITLTLLSTLESVIMVVIAMLIMHQSAELFIPNIFLLLTGIITIGILYTLIGIALVVRYKKITEFLVPMAAIITTVQLPLIHFLGILEHSAFLIIPTSAPTLLMQGAYFSLSQWEWIYCLAYTIALIAGLTTWAYKAFHKHIIMKVT